MRRVRYAAAFRRDLRAELEYLWQRDETEWAFRLEEDLRELERLLARFPLAGRELDREGAASLRRIRLRRSPFVVWYTTDTRRGEVVIARLFHARQSTPAPRLP